MKGNASTTSGDTVAALPCTGSDSRDVVGRFAPSPTGRMHAGNLFASLMSWLIVKSQGGRMVLRIEDLDVQRSKPRYADQIMRDLEFLGLTWDEGPFYQHGRNDAYQAAYAKLEDAGLVYPCFCTRADLHAASAPHRGEKLVYPGTCRSLTEAQARARAAERDPAMRVIVPDATVEIEDLVQGPFKLNLAEECGDFTVKRSDGLFAYQLAVVVDDSEQGVNCIVRGVDLLVSTPQQAYLQQVLGLGACSYAHIPLLVAERDRRLSKRDKDAGMDELVERFKTPEAIVGHLAATTGLSEPCEPCTCEELLEQFDSGSLRSLFPDLIQIPWSA